MTYNYESELRPYLGKTDKEIEAYVDSELATANSESYRKIKELSSMLRRQRKPATAAQAAEKLFEKTKAPDHLNMYLVAVVDSDGDVEKIKGLDKIAAEYVKEQATNDEERLHLYATRLKAANHLQDNGMFENIYQEIPTENKMGNNYIVNQYYIYLGRNGRYQEIINHYISLNPDMQKDGTLTRRYKDAVQKIGTDKKPSAFLIGPNSAELMFADIVLQTLGVRVIRVTGNASEILQQMESDTFESRFAVVCGTEYEDFLWGYFFGKMRASNLVILAKNKSEEDLVPSYGLKRYFLYPPSPEVANFDQWRSLLVERMKASGLQVS